MEIRREILNNHHMSTGSNIYSIDAIRRNPITVNTMKNQTKQLPEQVITMRIRKDLSAPIDAGSDDLIFLCREDGLSHIVQMYSGSEVPGAPKDSIFYKNTPYGDVIKHPSLCMQAIGSLDDFLDANVALADEIASEALILIDQLMLCRAVHHMQKTNCTAKEALKAAEHTNKIAIESQAELERATSNAIFSMEKH
jgi:hypothetical protein